MKSIVYFLIGVLSVAFVSADMDVGIGIDSRGGDIDADIRFDTRGGKFILNLNGQSFQDQISSMNTPTTSTRSMCDIQKVIAHAFLKKDGQTKEYYIPEWDDLDYCQGIMRFSIEQYTLNSVINMYEGRIRDLEQRIDRLEEVNQQEHLDALCDEGYWEDGVCVIDLEIDDTGVFE